MKDLSVTVNRSSHKKFPAIGKKNTNTPLKSSKLKPIRHWKDAVKEYCESL